MFKALLIDDSKPIHTTIAKMIGDDYELSFANNGKKGIKQAYENRPDLILLDVEMPGLNGYETCEIIRDIPELKNTPIIILSSKSSLRERMMGYSSGADDYLTKPCDRDELKAKISILLNRQSQINDLEGKYNQYKDTALTAMSNLSEMGRVLQFCEQCLQVSNRPDLAKKVFSVTDSLGLKCCLFFSNDEEFYSSTGVVSPLEKEIITMLHSEKRLIDFDARTQVNFPSVSLLVKNMPLSDHDTYGRWRDLLPIMMQAVEAKLESLNVEDALMKSANALSYAFGDVRTTMDKLMDSQQQNQEKGAQIMRSLLEAMDARLPSMGLEDDQEKFLTDLVDKAVQDTIQVVDAGKEMADAVNHVNLMFGRLVEEQVKLTQKMQQHLPETEDNSDDDQDLDMDVELF